MSKKKRYCNWTMPQLIEALSKKDEYTAREIDDLDLFSSSSLNSANRAGLLPARFEKNVNLIKYISYYVYRHEGQLKAKQLTEERRKKKAQRVDLNKMEEANLTKKLNDNSQNQQKNEKSQQMNFISRSEPTAQHNGIEIRAVDTSIIQLSKYECLVKMPIDTLDFMSRYMNMSKILVIRS
jgi:hypothetical protein